VKFKDVWESVMKDLKSFADDVKVFFGAERVKPSYDREIALLVEMGYTNTEALVPMLQRTTGNVALVVNWIEEQRKQQGQQQGAEDKDKVKA